MGEFFSFMCAFFRGWKRKVGCVTLFLAGLGVSDMLRTIAIAESIQPQEAVSIVLIEQSVLVFLFTFISAYMLLSRRPKSQSPVTSGNINSK
ncbi:MAG: hypothetical protein JWP89_1428 [Schlesneria sp.]|nr:hypothetical protein [Schlesneria sp.]